MKAYIVPEGHFDITLFDVLSTPKFVTVQGKNLKPGMVVLDHDLKTPEFVLDVRQPSTRNSGNVEFLALDLNDGVYRKFIAFSNTYIAVMAAS